jgi:3-methylcrotonyl-CoA carboxylase alpha subunit
MSVLPTRLLIANRGEIACRIIRTARRLGIETIAVYSDADRHALHVRMADCALRIGPPIARDSYLNIDALLDAARRSGAEAVHPGYGFLSENAEFAEACEAAGLRFVGPPAAAIRAMGSKSASKRVLEGAGVPLTPGYHGDAQDPALLQAEADRIGYPLLIKASAGGGGKGIRRVDRSEDFAAALAACQREASASFDDPRVLLERYIVQARHIEIQVFADMHGNAIHLGERDCSIQRRHQKVLEEAPAPGMTPERRAAMGQAAVNAALRGGYVGAGTVEFIVEPDGRFFFMEMNTRLQVEHPVTEMITGLDLVEWQLRIAAGARLPLVQEALRLVGHAIEVRLYAEDPSRGFLPSPGRVRTWQPPATPGVRIDAGIESGDDITGFYDAMIAKLIVHGENREQALARLRHALRETFLVGPRNNLQFLARLIDTRSGRDAALDTQLIEREHASLMADEAALGAELWLAAVAALLLHEAYTPHEQRRSPWDRHDGFRIAGTCRRRLTLDAYAERRDVEIEYTTRGWRITLDRDYAVQAHRVDIQHVDMQRTDMQRLVLDIDGVAKSVWCNLEAPVVHIRVDGRQASVRILDPREPVDVQEGSEGGLRSPMPGRVVFVNVKAGDRVQRGAALLAIEAMKMEHVICAPADGIVQAVHVTAGAQVAEAVALVDFLAE